MLRDEGGLLVGYVYVDVDPSVDIGGYVAHAREEVAEADAPRTQAAHSRPPSSNPLRGRAERCDRWRST